MSIDLIKYNSFMIYNSFNFIVLFPLIFLLYYIIPAKYQKGRNAFLLAVSYLLYINWNPVYALILLEVTVATFLFARLLADSNHCKSLLWWGG